LLKGVGNMKKCSIFIIFIIFIITGCARKMEVPPIAEVPQKKNIKETISEQPKILEGPEEVIPLEERPFEEITETYPPEEKITKENLEYWKNYGRSDPPLFAIFFDFDAFNIREDMWERIKKNAEYLLRHPDIKIQLQGNCDERGTKEYNMALGAKRALEVKDVLIKLGIKENRISTISFGEERPLCKESNEECWAINRRVDFVIIK